MSGPSGPWLRLGRCPHCEAMPNLSDVNGKLFQAMGFLQWLPFVIPLYHQRWGKAYCDMRVHFPLLVTFVLVLAGIGLARNARQLMLIGPFQAALTCLLWVAHQESRITARTVVKAGVLAVRLSGRHHLVCRPVGRHDGGA